jgi:hypothetical protein
MAGFSLARRAKRHSRASVIDQRIGSFPHRAEIDRALGGYGFHFWHSLFSAG